LTSVQVSQLPSRSLSMSLSCALVMSMVWSQSLESSPVPSVWSIPFVVAGIAETPTTNMETSARDANATTDSVFVFSGILHSLGTAYNPTLHLLFGSSIEPHGTCFEPNARLPFVCTFVSGSPYGSCIQLSPVSEAQVDAGTMGATIDKIGKRLWPGISEIRQRGGKHWDDRRAPFTLVRYVSAGESTSIKGIDCTSLNIKAKEN